MRVIGLWRFPVKSMAAAAIDELELAAGGVAGDRAFGVFDAASGTILSAKREGRLLYATSRLEESGEVVVTLPDAAEQRLGPELDAKLCDWLERDCRLVAAASHGIGTFECPEDIEHEDASIVAWDGPDGSFVDSSPLHLLTTATLRAVRGERPDLDWALTRFRPNVLIETDEDEPPEQDWLGTTLRIGEAEVVVDGPCGRCVMATRPQQGGVERSLDILRHLNAERSGALGVLAHVASPGVVRIGDVVEPLGPSTGAC